MSTNSKINVFKLLKERLPLFEPFESVYLFGSAVNPDLIYHDVDILIIYEKYSHETNAALQETLNELQKAIDSFIDLTALSIEEERETAFLAKLKSQYIKIK